MKAYRFSFLFVCALLFLSATNTAKSQNTLSINSTTTLPGSVVSIEVVMNNANPAVAFQLDVSIPTGFSYDIGSIALNLSRITNHEITASVISGPKLRIISHSVTNDEYTGSSGIIATFNLNASGTLGNYSLNITNAVISDASGSQILTGTTNGTVTVAKGTPDITWPTAAAITYGAQLSSATLSGGSATFDGETVAGSFAYINPTTEPNAGTYTADVRFTPSNTDLYNTVDGTVDVTVNKRTLTVTGIAAVNKVYNGNTSATLNFSGHLLNNVVSGDVVSINQSSYTANFDSKNIGEDKAVSVTLSLTGTDAANYTLTQPTGLTADITAKELTITGVLVNNKVYDGDTDATLNLSSVALLGVVGSENVSLVTDGYVANFNSKNIGTNKPVTISGFSISGSDIGNYTLTQPTGLTANITAKALTVSSGITVVEKVYDGTTTATLNFSSPTLDGVVGFETVTLITSGYNASFDTKNIGTAKPVTVSGLALGGADASNYTLTQPTDLSGNITAKALTVSSISAINKTYDGTTTATLNVTGYVLNGKVGSETVTLNSEDYTANFNNKNVGNAKPVTVSGLSLGGADAGNYTLTQPTGLTANITAKALTVTGITADNKVYDRSTTATLNFTSASLVGKIGTDVVSINTSTYTATFSNWNVGTGKTVTVSGLGLTGTDAPNYTLTQPTGLTANITPKNLTIIGILAINRAYNGNITATLNFSSATLDGTISPDNVTINSSGYSASFTNKHVGNGKDVTVSGIILSGDQSTNYTLSQPTGLTANITALPINITANSYSKTYGDDDPTELNYDASISLVGDDEWNGNLVREIGENVGIYDILIGTLQIVDGNEGNNYNLSYTKGTLTISTRAITINAQAKSKVYGDDDPELTYTITGSIAAGDRDDGSLTRVEGENVGTRQIQRGTLKILNGEDEDMEENYSITYNAANLTITTRPITVTADAKNKTYGETDPPLTYQITSGSLAFSDNFTGAITRTTGENVGVYAISKGTLALTANYNLSFIGANFTISSRAITVTADAQSKVYGASDPPLTYQVTSGSLAGGDSWMGSLSRVAGADVGEYTINQGTLSITPGGSNYTITFNDAILTITLKDLTITADAKSKTYGADDPQLTYTTDGLVGSDAVSGSLTRVSGNTVGTYAIGQGTLSAGSNYNLIFTGANFTINKRDLAITANSFIKTYLQEYTFQGDEFTYTDLFYDDTIESISLASDGAEVDAAPGDYEITISDADGSGLLNYEIQYNSGTLTVSDLIELNIINLVADSKVYDGTPNAIISNWGTLSGVETGDDVSLNTTSAVASFANKNVGSNKTVTVSGLALEGVDAYKYIIGNQTTTASITPKMLTITPDSDQGKIYGNSEPVITYLLTEGVLYGTDALSGALSRNSGENVGSYEITTGTLSAGGNYSISLTSGVMFTIDQRPITWTADAKDKVYGASDPTFTYQLTAGSYVGVDADNINGSLSRVAGQDVGDYQIQQGTLSIGANYDVTFIPALLTINVKSLTLTANDIEKAQGVEYQFLGTEFTAIGLVTSYGDAIESVELISDGAPAGAEVGDFPIFIDNASPDSGTELDNYDISYVPGTLSVVAKIPLTLEGIIIQNKVYDGSTDANITDWGSVIGIVGGDDVTVIYTDATAFFEDKNVGSGKTVSITGLTLEGEDAPKYIIGTQLATANITKRGLTLSNFTADSKFYDGTTDVEGAGFEDNRIEFDDLEFTFDAAFRFAVVNTASGNPRTVDFTNIQLNGGVDIDNYNLLTTSGSVVSAIYPRPITITPEEDQLKVYGQVDPDFTWNLTGGTLVEGEEDIITGNLSREIGQDVGLYEILLGSLNAGTNYEITLTPIDFEIIRKNLTVSANDIVKSFGVEYIFSGSEFTAEGLVVSYGDDIESVALQSDGTSADALEGTYPISITDVFPSPGTDLNNYNLNTVDGELTVLDKIILTLSDVIAEDKIYDGTVNASIIYWGSLNGVEPGDEVELDITDANAIFSNKNVENNKIVTISGLNLSGEDANKYYIEDQTAEADITPRGLILSNFIADSKIYDGSTDVTNADFDDNRITDDILEFTFDVVFVNPDAGNNINVNFTNINISGGIDANNYELSSSTGTAHADIYPKPITASVDEDQSKIYGEADPILTYSFDEDQLIGDDELSGVLERETGEAVGVYSINIGTLTAGNNYSLSLDNEAVFTIYGLLTLEVEPQGTGTVSGGGLYLNGDLIDISAIPNEGYVFVSWTNEESTVISTIPDFTYIMPTSSVILTANFSEILPQYVLELNVSPEGAGTVSGAGEYIEGALVEISATPSAGYQFVNWTNEDEEIISTNETFTFNMPANNLTLTANFEELPPVFYTLTLLVNPLGAGIATGEGEYEEGEEVEITATPEGDYVFVNWTDIDGNILEDEFGDPVDASFTYIMPANDVTLIANFAFEGQYQVIVTIIPTGSGIVTGTGSYYENDEVTLEAIPNEDYQFLYWKDITGNIISEELEYNFIMPNENVLLSANFELLPPPLYTLTLVVNPDNAGVVTGGGEYEEGDEIEVSAVPQGDYYFVNWTDTNGNEVVDGSGDPVGASFIYTMPASNVILTANFAIEGQYEVAVVINPIGAGVVTGAGWYFEDDEVALTATPNNGYIFENWTDDGNIVSTEAIYVFTMPAENILLTANFIPLYTVTFVVTNPDEEAIEGALIVIDQEKELITNAQGIASIELLSGTYSFSVTADDYFEYNDSFTVDDENMTINVELEPVGIVSSILSNLVVYPNPFNNIINFTLADKVDRVVVTSLVGQTIVVLHNPNGIFYVDNFRSGVYIFRFIAKDGSQTVRKMVKE
jgi:uncharacterized repeat protein (TIGR02543 family)